jgi:hypothetical protein
VATNNLSIPYFSILINGVLQSRYATNGAPLYNIGINSSCSGGMRFLTYDWTNAAPGSNTIQVIFTNQIYLSDTRTVAVARPGDSDGDGMSDYAELIAGTDPFNANSLLRITSLDAGSQLIVWDSATNVNYQVLATTNWNYPLLPISPIIPSAGASTFYFDTAPDPTNKFYRIQVAP